MDDIEELQVEEIVASRKSPASDLAGEQLLTRRKLVKSTKLQEESPPISDDELLSTAFLPGKGLVYVKTWGCSHNNSDGEYMAGMLAEQGYNIVLADADRDKAKVWILNSCTVKGPSEAGFFNFIKAAESCGKKIVVAGCVPQAAQRDPRWSNYSSIGVQQIDRVVEVVEETMKGNVVQLFRPYADEQQNRKKAGGAPLNMPKIRKNPLIEIIPLNTGCLNQCTYCKTKQARGDLASYYPEDIYKRIRQVLDENVVEIWLTSEDTGTYGLDIGTNIDILLNGITAVLDEYSDSNVRLRIGMTNPPYIMDHLEGIANVLNHPKVYKFLHLPVQAASDKVLNDMRRLYTHEQFCYIVDFLREKVPGITIATDIICGFPTETSDDFDETLALLERYKFPILHISQFYPRQGTPAANMVQVNSLDKKNRSRAATRIFESYFPYNSLVNSQQVVLVTEWSKDGNHYVSHDACYRQVLVPKNDAYMGRLLLVEIESASRWSMVGKVVQVLTNGSSVNIPQFINKQGKLVHCGTGDATINAAKSQKPPSDAAKPSNLVTDIILIVVPYVVLTAVILFWSQLDSQFSFKLMLLLIVWYSCFKRIGNGIDHHKKISQLYQQQAISQFHSVIDQKI